MAGQLRELRFCVGSFGLELGRLLWLAEVFGAVP
jgi:hypothetical protein